MKIALVMEAVLPVTKYGGTERVVWYLAKALTELGHEVTLYCKAGSRCSFADVLFLSDEIPLAEQIQKGTDIVHFHSSFHLSASLDVPCIFTMHGNPAYSSMLPNNTVFVSENHAERYGSTAFVHNGLYWEDYSEVNLDATGDYFHFLGNAAWRVKNVKGAIGVASESGQNIKIVGGSRLNFRMGFRFTWNIKASFMGNLGGVEKDSVLMSSRGLIFPVRWHEPFGLAIIESLYFGCPVFGTPYGSLPELVNDKVGFLSDSKQALAAAVGDYQKFNRHQCHLYARENFNAKKMAAGYVEKYNQVISGKLLNVHQPTLQVKPQEKFLPWLS